MRTLYAGPMDRRKMPRDVLTAYESFCRQKKEKGVSYTAREFIPWWLENLKTFAGRRPSCGRIDHSKPYSWDNIFMQDVSENSRESAIRNKFGEKGKERFAKAVWVFDCDMNYIATVPTIRETARIFGVSQRSVQFTIRGVWKKPKFLGNLILKAAA